MDTTPTPDDAQDGPVVHPDGLVINENLLIRVDSGVHAAAICDPDDPDDPAWQPSSTPVRCALYWPGHNVHWIQARKGLNTPATPYTLLDCDGQWATFGSESGTQHQWRFHDTTTLAALLLLEGPSTVYLHEHGLLRAGRSLLYPCVSESSWQDCRPSRLTTP